MKTTLEIPDDLLNRTEAAASIRGESLAELVIAALQAHLERQTAESPSQGWRSVFGQARREEVESVDAVIAEELERIDPDK